MQKEDMLREAINNWNVFYEKGFSAKQKEKIFNDFWKFIKSFSPRIVESVCSNWHLDNNGMPTSKTLLSFCKKFADGDACFSNLTTDSEFKSLERSNDIIYARLLKEMEISKEDDLYDFFKSIRTMMLSNRIKAERGIRNWVDLKNVIGINKYI